jgi:hypothetical protein
VGKRLQNFSLGIGKKKEEYEIEYILIKTLCERRFDGKDSRSCLL